MEVKLYMLAASFCSWLVACVDSVHSLSSFWLHPWSTRDAFVIMVSMIALCVVTPLSPGLNIVVYLFSDILLMLTSDFMRPGSILASLSLVNS